MARDFFEAGKVAGHLSARIIRGEKAAELPFEAVTQTKLVLYLKAALEQGISFPAAILKKTDLIIKTVP